MGVNSFVNTDFVKINYNNGMKRIIFLIAVMTLLLSCGNKQPQKTPEQIKAEELSAFRQKAVIGLEKYLKRHFSADPDYGRVLELSDTTLNDSLFRGEMRFAIKNPFGAVQQFEGYLFCICKKDSTMYLGLWDSYPKYMGDYMVARGMAGDEKAYTDIPQEPTYEFVVKHGVVME